MQGQIPAGSQKSLMALGHAVIEEGGMKECATWLKSSIPEVPIAHVPAGEPDLMARPDSEIDFFRH